MGLTDGPAAWTFPGGADRATTRNRTAIPRHIRGSGPSLIVPRILHRSFGGPALESSKDSAGGEDRSRVVLCGPACDTVKADPRTVVDIVLGCAVIVKYDFRRESVCDDQQMLRR